MLTFWFFFFFFFFDNIIFRTLKEETFFPPYQQVYDIQYAVALDISFSRGASIIIIILQIFD